MNRAFEYGSGQTATSQAYPRPQVSLRPCLRCGSENTLRLQKAQQEAHTCYRCRDCGHIFSPAEE
ncbi:MAG: hypothetical protein ACOC5K_05130 [Chloroflexota bacterium]